MVTLGRFQLTLLVGPLLFVLCLAGSVVAWEPVKEFTVLLHVVDAETQSGTA